MGRMPLVRLEMELQGFKASILLLISALGSPWDFLDHTLDAIDGYRRNIDGLGIDVEKLGCEVARLGVAKKCCLGLVVSQVEEETKRMMWSLGDQVGSLSTL
ncbi:hypothetical protein Tco_0947382 [Tanacetum coccineum]